MKNFEDFMISRNDEIDNAAYELLSLLAGGKDIEWNMEHIGNVWETAEAELKTAGIDFCHPYYVDDNTPCYEAGDCNCKECLFTGKKLKEETK